MLWLRQNVWLAVLSVSVLAGVFGLWLVSSNLFDKNLARVSPTPSPTPVTSGLDRQIDSLSLKEKMAQLFMISLETSELSASESAFLENYGVGGIVLFEKNIVNPSQVNNLTSEIASTGAELKKPWIAVDQEGGQVTRLPWLDDGVPQTQVLEAQVAYDLAASRAAEFKRVGINMNLAPVIEHVRNDFSYISKLERSFKSKRPMVNDFSLSSMQAYEDAEIFSVVKHLPFGLGMIDLDPHQLLPRVDMKKQKTVDELKTAGPVLEKADAVMVTHLLYPDIDEFWPTSLSYEFNTEILRKSLGYEGVIMVDDLRMGAIEENYSLYEAVHQAINSGADMVIINEPIKVIEPIIDRLVQQVGLGFLDEIKVDSAVKKVIRLKNKYSTN